MEIQDYPVTQNTHTMEGSLQHFLQFKDSVDVSQKQFKYFVQINLFTDYLQLIIQFCLEILSKKHSFKYELKKQRVDQQFYCLYLLKGSDGSQITLKLLIIQMDRVIKVFFQKLNQNQKVFQNRDEFWFDFKNFLNPKISNFYKLSSIKQLKENKQIGQKNSSQLNHIFVSHLLQVLASSQLELSNIRQTDNLRFFNPNQSFETGHNFCLMFATSQNLCLICQFLDIKSICRLKLTSRIFKRYIFGKETQFYKKLYEFSFGKTGFTQSQLNWRLSLNKKREQKKKQMQKVFRKKY